ncbi:MAG: hypothetical protein V8Q40_11015 [Anaerosacchariphilus sp.]
MQYEPELLGEMKDIPVPDFSNEASVKEYLGKIKTRSEMIAEMPYTFLLCRAMRRVRHDLSLNRKASEKYHTVKQG